jgi:hypothetical protein
MSPQHTMHQPLSKAVEELKRELATQVHQARDTITAKIAATTESTFWKMAPVVLPVLLGALIWWLQLGTNQRIDAAGKELSAKLALREEFYKRKFTVYEDAHKQMIAVLGAADALRIEPASAQKRADLADNLLRLYEVVGTNGLYMSKDVADGLTDIWVTGTGVREPRVLELKSQRVKSPAKSQERALPRHPLKRLARGNKSYRHARE